MHVSALYTTHNAIQEHRIKFQNYSGVQLQRRSFSQWRCGYLETRRCFKML